MTPLRLRILTISLITVTLIALAACGSSPHTIFCPVATADGCCGPLPSPACPIGPQHLYATGLSGLGTGQVTEFPITNTGGLESSASVPGPVATFGMTALGNQFLYVSNPALVSGSGAPSIYGWTIDQSTGALTTVAGSPFPLNSLPFPSVPMGLAADPALQMIYVADAGSIDALQADSTGKLTPISGSPFTSGGNLFLTIDPQNRFLFASDETPPGNVLAFTIQPNGGLAPVAGSPFPAVPGSANSSMPWEVVVDQSGSFVYVALVTSGQVAGFSINPTTGVLAPVPGSPFSIANQPIGLHPLALATVGNYLYVGSGTISGYSIDVTTGALTALPNSQVPVIAAALTIGGVGPTLYASGAGGISAFTINTQAGGLTPVAGSPFPAPGATVLTVVP
jgi:hypothetical protein